MPMIKMLSTYILGGVLKKAVISTVGDPAMTTQERAVQLPKA